MGRFYNIVVGNGFTWTSDPGGTPDPGALGILLDLPVVDQRPASQTGCFVRIWGLPLDIISQANNFNKQSIQVYGGMSAGLPLADPSQQGLLVQGIILPAFGNWVNTDMTLDLNITAGSATSGTAGGGGEGTPPAQANIFHQHLQNTPMSQAIQTALSTAFPWATPLIQISPSLVQAFDDNHYAQTLAQYADLLFQRSKSIMNSSSYAGIHVTLDGNTIKVQDGTMTPNNHQINFTDIIGQPTWIGPTSIQVKLVMRGDLKLRDTITLPTVIGTTTAASFNAGQGPNLSFQGTFTITSMRHVGNFREPSWASWNTTIDCVQATSS